MTAWYEDESFWQATFSFMFPEERLAAGGDDVDRILTRTGLEGADVLDLCAGPGRHAVPLARRGCRVTAVDRSPFLLDKARERVRAAGVEVEFVQEDMRRFQRPGAFDLAVSLFSSFGYFDDTADDRTVLANVFYSLRPGGRLVMDLLGKEVLARVYRPVHVSYTPEGTAVYQETEILPDWTRARCRWTLVQGDEARTFDFHLNLYSGVELRALLRSVGFADITLSGGLDGSAYDVTAGRLGVVAVHPVGAE